MSTNRKLVKTIRKYYKTICASTAKLKKLLLLLLRTFIVTKRKTRSANAGFVLPTVAMVSIVVVLLTVAILFRSFERSKNASNVRVNEIVLKAATPAIDRAKAKIEQLFIDPTLPRYTPSEGSLYNAFVKDVKKYTFGDETPLTVNYDINGQSGIENTGALEAKESIQTAWRFAVDTDNNGKYDSFTLYGIFLRSPSRGDDGKFDRPRKPLDARTPPMDDGTLGDFCSAAKGTSASLVGETGWYRSGGNLKKSFFVYSATVPIKDATASTTYGTNFEVYKGNRGFSALEFQQDQERIPIVNNAVVYEDDLEITPGSGLRLNGSIFTNSNLITGESSNDIELFLVSSPKSCFYRAENSKIVVGGNVAHGRINGTGDTNRAVSVNLYKPPSTSGTTTIISSEISQTNKSASNTAAQIAYNTRAYAERINKLVEDHRGSNQATFATFSNDPKEVQDNIKARLGDSPGDNNSDETISKVRREELETYFRKRTRRVPFAEVSQTANGVNTTNAVLQGSASANTLRPIDNWIFPRDGFTSLTISPAQLEAIQPQKLKETYKNEEKKLGDRIIAGNNLPALWFDAVKGFVGKNVEELVDGTTEWTEVSDASKRLRTRSTRVDQLINLGGVVERGGYFEEEATKKPKNALDNVGGMRVITGAGIYVDGPSTGANAGFFPWDVTPPATEWTPALPVAPEPRSFFASLRPQWDSNLVDPANNPSATNPKVKVSDLNFLTQAPIIVWPDSMPMAGGNGQTGQKGDLLMRATAVYHYATEIGKEQKPIACVSSYYNPTNPITAQNRNNLKTTYWPNPNADIATTVGGSNNGIVYPSYAGTRAAAISANRAKLQRQSRLVFPDGRFVNENLRNALKNVDASEPLSMAQNSAVDTAVCALQILEGTLSPSGSPPIPHGSIYETAFLDARQVKSVEKEPNVADSNSNNVADSSESILNTDFDRSIEERQPLEVRTTVINLGGNSLGGVREKRITGTNVITGINEYLIPNSGLIYASREDALTDLSVSPSADIDERKLISPTDYRLDPTRRPNGIMLINGDRLDRETNYRDAEKGLILASNVPVYIKGHFNRHSKAGNSSNPVQEFTQTLTSNWSNFYNGRNDLNTDFACRKNDPRLPVTACRDGDSWRPASVIADAVTILSDNFRFGFRNEGDYDLRNNEATRVVPNFDFDGNGNSYIANNLNEIVRREDLNNNGNRTDTNVNNVRVVDNLNEIVFGVDLNNDGDATDTDVDQVHIINNLNETFFDVDLNGDGDATDTDVDGFRPYTITEKRLNKDLNGDGDKNDSPSGANRQDNLNEITLNIDLNGDGDTTDTDVDGVNAENLDETVVGFDLNGDGDTADTSVSEFNGISVIAVRRRQGFYDNNYLTNSDWYDASGYPRQGSSYVNNFVTPIQRRVQFNEYVMEICTKIPTTLCEANDWSINGSGLKATSQVGQTYNLSTHRAGTTVDLADNSGISLRRFTRRVAFARKPDGTLILDTNGHPVPLGVDNASPRRIRAFSNGNLPVGSPITVTPLSSLYLTPSTNPTALWFRTTNILPNNALPTDTNYGYSDSASSKPLFYQTVNNQPLTGTNPNEQPILVPVLQIQMPVGATISTNPSLDPSNNLGDLPGLGDRGIARDRNWIQQAANTTTNLAIAAGDTPSRASTGTNPSESGGGLENFVRYLEMWETAPNTAFSSAISGSLIQYRRSAFATAPWQVLTHNTSNQSAATSIYAVPGDVNYVQFYKTSSTPVPNSTGQGIGMSPFYTPPSRQWGFDVALLSQLPDLFAQQFTLPPSGKPNEFFREVNRDDPWVQTLLCAKVTNISDLNAAPTTLPNAIPANERPNQFCQQNTGG